MEYIGDYFALGLVVVLCMFYFEGKTGTRYMSASSKYFVAGLILTALTAVVDMITCRLLELPNVPLWLNMAANSLYFVVNIVTTSAIALFLFSKILKHTYNSHWMRNAWVSLAVLFLAYLVLVILNLWTGWLFYFDAQGNYHRGPLNAMGYAVTICQMGLVTVCYFRNARNASRPMRQVLLRTFPVIVICILIQRIYPEIMLNCFIMAMVETVLFLSFQGQRQGIHSLTELNDRHCFFREAELRIARGEKFHVFRINIKEFGVINQKYGHIFGDEFLYQFASSLEKLFRNSMAFHMNGTIFALILPYDNQAAAEERGRKLLEFLERGIVCLNHHVLINFVLVDYVVSEQENDAAKFYERLEYAAGKAVEQKLHYVHYVPQLGQEMNRVRYLQERLRKIDREHGFEVWYQPIQWLSTEKFCSMEALVRLREPDGSLISPGEFIPLAEKTGHIAPITWFVIEEACDLLKNRPELEGVSISVNLPMPQLLEEGFADRLNRIVDRAGIAHHRICLELTERSILENFPKTLEIMTELTQEGYRFYLDDFGTGYSNFSYLLQLPFQIIKLDASLLHPAREGKGSYAVVRTLTELFHDMSLTVVAEGVETAQEVADLARQGVDRIQGYALARPMPEQDLLNFYREHPAT